jgi:hypothetical protein
MQNGNYVGRNGRNIGNCDIAARALPATAWSTDTRSKSKTADPAPL